MQTSGITKEMTQKNTYSRVKPCDYRCLLMRLFIFAYATIRISSFDYSSFYSFIVIALPL